jgi:hypothetical protein
MNEVMAHAEAPIDIYTGAHIRSQSLAIAIILCKQRLMENREGGINLIKITLSNDYPSLAQELVTAPLLLEYQFLNYFPLPLVRYDLADFCLLCFQQVHDLDQSLGHPLSNQVVARRGKVQAVWIPILDPLFSGHAMIRYGLVEVKCVACWLLSATMEGGLMQQREYKRGQTKEDDSLTNFVCCTP